MMDRAWEYRTRNLNVLNPNQKAKLNVLEEAVKLAPTTWEARDWNLIGEFDSPPRYLAGTDLRPGLLALYAGGRANGCSLSPFGAGRSTICGNKRRSRPTVPAGASRVIQ